MASQTRTGTIFGNNTGTGDVAWVGAGNAQTQDGIYSGCSLSDPLPFSQYLSCSGYGFTIPYSALITGVSVRIRRKQSATNFAITDSESRLLIGGNIGKGNFVNQASPEVWTTTATDFTYGGVGDYGGELLTPTIVNASNFGSLIAVIFSVGISLSGIAQIDVVEITIYYEQVLHTGFLTPTTVSQKFVTGNGWTNQNNIKVSDGLFANDNAIGDVTDFICAEGFNANIPSSAIPLGVLVFIQRRDESISARDYSIRYLKADTLVGGEFPGSDTWDADNKFVARGEWNNLQGITLTAAEANAAGFGVALSIFAGDPGPTGVDNIRIVVVYESAFNQSLDCNDQGLTIEDILRGALLTNGTTNALRVTKV